MRVVVDLLLACVVCRDREMTRSRRISDLEGLLSEVCRRVGLGDDRFTADDASVPTTRASRRERSACALNIVV